MRLYYFAPISSFNTLTGIEYQSAHIGTNALGWVDWTADTTQRAGFEAGAGVISLQNILTPGTIPSALVTRLSQFGVLATDTRWDALNKVVAALGALELRI